MKSHEELLSLHTSAKEALKKLRPILREANLSVSKFYEAMRWEDNSCSEEEYESLYDLVYLVDRENLLELLDRLTESLDEI